MFEHIEKGRMALSNWRKDTKMLGDRHIEETSTKDLESVVTAIETELAEGGIPLGEQAQMEQEQAAILEELRRHRG